MTLFCFGVDFFQAADDDDFYCDHNLGKDKLVKQVQEYSNKGFVFCAEQNALHNPIQSDCIECLQIYNYILGFWNYIKGTRLPSPKIKKWKISIASGSLMTSLLNEDLAQGKNLYESSDGKKILKTNGMDIDTNLSLVNLIDIKYARYLNTHPIYEISYLAMYNKAASFGYSADQANNYAFFRGNVYTFATLLALMNNILVI